MYFSNLQPANKSVHVVNICVYISVTDVFFGGIQENELSKFIVVWSVEYF